MVRTVLLLAWIATAGCATPKTAAAPPDDGLAALKSEVAALKQEIDAMRNRLGHLDSKVDANNPEGEFTEMTIDWIRWSDDQELNLGAAAFGKQPRLLCHVVEWDGFGRLKRFTRVADQQFFLEAPDHPTVAARMAEGGVSNDDGSTRFAVLSVVGGPPVPGVEYAVRPRNEVEGYRWEVSDGVRVARGR